MRKYLRHNKTRQKAIKETFFNEDGHLNDLAVITYVQAKLIGKEEEVDLQIAQHLEQCPQCQSEVFLFYEMMQDEVPSEIDVTENKDLALMLTPAKRQWSKPLMKIAASVVVAFVASLALLFFPQYQPDNISYSPFEQHQEVEAPVKHWELKNNRPYTLFTPSGVKIQIPANAFVDEQGNVVRGKVDVSFKELRKPSEILASGQVLPYDSAGLAYPLESFGMFEIRAEQEGKKLQLAQQKHLKLEMPLSAYSTELSNYYLVENDNLLSQLQLANANSENSRWQYLGKSQLKILNEQPQKSLKELKKQKTEEIDSLAQYIIREQDRITQQSKQLQIEKKIPQNTSDYFKIELDEVEYQSQNPYRTQVWQYVGESSLLSPTAGQDWVLQERWNRLQLTPAHYRSLTLTGHQGVVTKAIFSPDNALVATASSDYTVRLWSKEAQYLRTLKGHRGVVNDIAFSPDGRYIASASDDRTLRLWRKDGKLIRLLSGHTAGVKSVTFSPDGYYILSHGGEGRAKLWSVEGNLLATLSHVNNKVAPKFSPNGKYVATIENTDYIRLFSINNASSTLIKGDFNTLSFSPNSELLLSTSTKSNGKIALYSIKGRRIRNYDFNAENAKFTQDGQYILTQKGARLQLWFFNQKAPYNLVLTRNMFDVSSEYRSGHEKTITMFTSNKQNIFSASEDYTAKIWTKEGSILHNLRGHTNKINSIDYSSDGGLFVTASDDFSAKIWVERQNKNVYEMHLTKDERIIRDPKGKQVHIPGKEFFTIVEKVDNQENIKVIKKPDIKENLLEQLLIDYEQLVAEKEALDSQKALPMPEVSQVIEISRLGIYNCAKVYPTNPNNQVNIKEAYIHFENARPENPTTVYHVTAKFGVTIIPYEYHLGQALDFSYDPSAYNSLIVILDDNKVCQFSNHDFATISPLIYSENHGLYRFDVSPPVQVSNQRSLSTLMR